MGDPDCSWGVSLAEHPRFSSERWLASPNNGDRAISESRTLAQHPEITRGTIGINVWRAARSYTAAVTGEARVTMISEVGEP